jgi:cell division cycle 2-like protein
MAVVPCRDITSYELLNHIQEGTYGVVTRARDKQSGRLVALKKIKVDSPEEIFPITSIREIHILRPFKHPNIVQLYEVITSTSISNSMASFYLVLELVEHDLKGIMLAHGEFTISEVKTIVKQVLSGLAALHNRCIMHRDLKPSNLLLTNNGIVKIADFGLATQFGADRAYTAVVVTLWYRAPELLIGGTKAVGYGPEIDMWSVGCILGELLKNDVILKGTSEIDQLNVIFQLVGITYDEWTLIKGQPTLRAIKKPRLSSASDLSLKPLVSQIKRKQVTDTCVELLCELLTIESKSRVSASKALMHAWFKEQPFPKPPELFPTFPSSANLEVRKAPN